MKKHEFDIALAMAQSHQELTQYDDSPLVGCGLPDFEPVVVTIGAVARFIRWQCYQLNGSQDNHAIEQCRQILVYPRKKVEVFNLELHCPHCNEQFDLKKLYQ